MMNELLSLEDLDESRQPRTEWLRSRNLQGILFIEVPGQKGFENIVDQKIGFRFEEIVVIHAEFGHPLTMDTFYDASKAYRFVFSIIYQDVFIFIRSRDASFLLWMPPNHNFYALFGQAEHLRASFSDDLKDIQRKFDDYAASSAFNDLAKNYLSQAKNKYFTARDIVER